MLLSADEEPGMSFLGYLFADNRGVLSEDIQSQEALLSTEQEARMHAFMSKSMGTMADYLVTNSEQTSNHRRHWSV